MSFWTDQRVVVTGGAGFTGIHVVQALLARGCREIVVVRSREHDLTREADVIRLFENTCPDVVIHLAGLVGSIASTEGRPADSFYRNLLMGTCVLHYSWLFGVKKFVATIAGCDYPDTAGLPFNESSLWDGYPQEETAAYSLAKRILHIQAGAYYKQHSFSSAILIPGNIYGPHDNFDRYEARVAAALIRKFVEATERGDPEVAVWGEGRATRDFVFATDVAQGILLAVERGGAAELFNISSGTETSIRELAETLAAVTGFHGRIAWDASQPEGQLRRWMDTTRARERLGFRAALSLKDGLTRTVEWYRAHRPTPVVAKRV